MRARRSAQFHFIGSRPSQSHFDLCNNGTVSSSLRTVLCCENSALNQVNQLWSEENSIKDSIYPERAFIVSCSRSKSIIEQFSSVQDLCEEANNTSTEAVLMVSQQDSETRKKCLVVQSISKISPIRTLNDISLIMFFSIQIICSIYCSIR